MSTINTQELDARIAEKLCRPAKAQMCKKMLRFLMALILSLFVNSIAYALIQNLPTSFKVQKPLPVNQLQKATLIVGSEQDFPPFATGMSDESAGGFTVELWKAVASEAGLNYHIRVLPFHQLLDEFKSGKIDVLINLNVTDEAHVYADFSVPHSVFNGGIFVRNNESNINSEVDLKGKSIIMMKDDVEANYATSRGWNNQLVFVEAAAEGMQMLASGSHDAMLINKVVGLQTLHSLKLDNIKALKAKAGFTQRFAFAVHTGQSELLGKIDEGLAVTKANGVYNNLYDKWFGVYELKEIGVVDLLKYLMPIVLIFICILGYILYLRHRERKQAEESLEMMRFSVDNAHDSIFWINREGHILYVNLAACMEREYSLKEMLQMRIFDLDPDYQPGIWTPHFEDLSRRGSISLETRHRTKNGRIFPVEVSANYINLNGKEFNFAVLRDITERKQAELALSISELSAKQSLAELKYQKSAVDEHAIVSVTDVQGIITYANSKFCKISGYTEEELLGQDHHILSSGYHPKGFFKEMYLTLATGKPWHDEICNRTKDGHLYWVDTTITPFMADDGKPKSYISIRTDITQRKAAEEKITF